MPSRNTPAVCVMVTIAPSAAACLMVPRAPTRYAATIALPCPGERAWNAPKTNAISRPNNIKPGVKRLTLMACVNASRGVEAACCRTLLPSDVDPADAVDVDRTAPGENSMCASVCCGGADSDCAG